MKPRAALLAIGAALLLAACADPATIPLDRVFPGSVGTFLRTSGPFTDAETGAEIGTYAGPEGEVTLSVRYVGSANVEYALSELPATATDVGYDEAIGPRSGVAFTYAAGYHAAWGNGDWVFVLNAPTPEARRAFLAGYGF